MLSSTVFMECFGVLVAHYSTSLYETQTNSPAKWIYWPTFLSRHQMADSPIWRNKKVMSFYSNKCLFFTVLITQPPWISILVHFLLVKIFALLSCCTFFYIILYETQTKIPAKWIYEPTSLSCHQMAESPIKIWTLNITCGRVLNGELYTCKLYKLINLCWSNIDWLTYTIDIKHYNFLKLARIQDRRSCQGAEVVCWLISNIMTHKLD